MIGVSGLNSPEEDETSIYRAEAMREQRSEINARADANFRAKSTPVIDTMVETISSKSL